VRMLTIECKGCGAVLAGETEDDLVASVQAHVAEAHPGGHAPSRELVLKVLRRRSAHES
jgi:hypothetical protein